MKSKKVDLIVHNAVIHCMDDNTITEEAMAIKDGIIVEVGPERQILNKYRTDEIIDANHKDIYPGFTDAHAHMFSLAKQNLGVDLTACRSMKDVVDSIDSYCKIKKRHFVIGRGWDQTQWKVDEMPTNELLNAFFPDIPVAIYRLDGHALLVNEVILEQVKKANPTYSSSSMATGLFIDLSMKLPEAQMNDFTPEEYKVELIKIQKELFHYGITGVHEAGVELWQYKLLKELVQKEKFKLDMYAMLSANEENYKFAKKVGIVKFKNLLVRSFKIYMDGALGSRGALLKVPYEDDGPNKGFQITEKAELDLWMKRALELDYQLNAHAIGDAGNEIVLKAFELAFKTKPDHRWRIEHAQIVDPKDFHYFSDFAIFPSVQPTHATSDQRWAEKRIGKHRMMGAYAYKSLYEQFGMIALGTDFPVEAMNPFQTIRSAVKRVDANNLPSKGFQVQEALSLDIVLKGMTIWPQFASFTESKRGMLVKGMEATFFICDKPFNEKNIPVDNFANKTFIKGQMVFDEEASY